MKRITTGRSWAYVGVVVGAGVSVLANVAHSYVPPADAAPGWTPHGGAVVGAVFWPVALLVAIEVLARVPWPPAARWTLIRFGGLIPVATVAAIVSYRHMSGLLAYYGEDGITAALGPLAVDGLMVMATGALLATRLTVTVPETAAAPVATPAKAPALVPGPRHSTTSRPAPQVTPAPAPVPAPTRVPAAQPSQVPGSPSRTAQIKDRIRTELLAGRDCPNLAALDREFKTSGVAKKAKAQVLRELAAETATSTTPVPTAPSNGHRVDGPGPLIGAET